MTPELRREVVQIVARLAIEAAQRITGCFDLNCQRKNCKDIRTAIVETFYPVMLATYECLTQRGVESQSELAHAVLCVPAESIPTQLRDLAENLLR